MTGSTAAGAASWAARALVAAPLVAGSGAARAAAPRAASPRVLLARFTMILLCGECWKVRRGDRPRHLRLNVILRSIVDFVKPVCRDGGRRLLGERRARR